MGLAPLRPLIFDTIGIVKAENEEKSADASPGGHFFPRTCFAIPTRVFPLTATFRATLRRAARRESRPESRLATRVWMVLE